MFKSKMGRFGPLFLIAVLFVAVFFSVKSFDSDESVVEEGRTSVLLVGSSESCNDVDLSSMPVYRVDRSGRSCYGRSDYSTTWDEDDWTLEKGDGYFRIGCDYEGGAWRAYGIMPVDVSDYNSVTLKADLGTTSSIVHYDNYVDLVVFDEDKTSELVDCDSTPSSLDDWGTKCALTDLSTDSLGHCGLPQSTSSISCDLDLDVSGVDMMYLTFIGKDAWDLAYGVLTDSFENVQLCTTGGGVSADTYDVYLRDESYDSDDDYIKFGFEFTTSKEQTVTIDILDEDGNFVNSTINMNVHLYSLDTSPHNFTLPIEWEEEGDYYVNVKVVDWTDWDGVNEDVVYLNDSLSFYYGGAGPVCGDGDCSDGEDCPADNCCDGEYTNCNSDEYNCGSCGNVCSLDYECQSGVCVDVGDYGDVNCTVYGCEEAYECAMGLSALEGCFMEILDVIPLLDKSVAVSLLGDDLCSLQERYELDDPIGMAVTSALLAIDLFDNAIDFTIVGYGVTVASDIVEGAIDCAEGILYEAVKLCGGYTSCMLDVARGIQNVTGGGIWYTRALSPVELYVVDSSGDPLERALVINESDMKFALVLEPDERDFNLLVAGTGSGTYDLETNVLDEGGELVYSGTLEDVSINWDDAHVFEVDVSSGYNEDELELEDYTVFSSSSSFSPSSSFSDMNEHWAKEYVDELAGDGVVNGYSDGTFKPNDPVTRAELLKIVLESFSDILPVTFGEGVNAKSNSFSDVYSTDWYYEYVTYAYYWNIVNGYGDGTFGPNNKVTRAEALKIIYLSTGFDLPLSVPVSTFSDVGESDWFKYYVMLAVSEGGVVNGFTDGTFRPNQTMTRAEVCKIVKLVRDRVLF